VNKSHGMAKRRNEHPIYIAWSSMKKRCLNTKSISYKNYGGRGIKICDHWFKFENFRDDMLKTWKDGLQLDRIDVNGNYELSNCKWSTRSENCKNRRNKSKIQSAIPFVSFNTKRGNWELKIRFDSEEKAAAAFIFLKMHNAN